MPYSFICAKPTLVDDEEMTAWLEWRKSAVRAVKSAEQKSVELAKTITRYSTRDFAQAQINIAAAALNTKPDPAQIATTSLVLLRKARGMDALREFQDGLTEFVEQQAILERREKRFRM